MASSVLDAVRHHEGNPSSEGPGPQMLKWGLPSGVQERRREKNTGMPQLERRLLSVALKGNQPFALSAPATL